MEWKKTGSIVGPVTKTYADALGVALAGDGLDYSSGSGLSVVDRLHYMRSTLSGNQIDSKMSDAYIAYVTADYSGYIFYLMFFMKAYVRFSGIVEAGSKVLVTVDALKQVNANGRYMLKTGVSNSTYRTLYSVTESSFQLEIKGAATAEGEVVRVFVY